MPTRGRDLLSCSSPPARSGARATGADRRRRPPHRPRHRRRRHRDVGHTPRLRRPDRHRSGGPTPATRSSVTRSRSGPPALPARTSPANPTGAPSSSTSAVRQDRTPRPDGHAIDGDRRVAAIVAGRRWNGGTRRRRRPTTRLVVPRCPGPARWIAFPGGYRMRRPACVALDVRVPAPHTQRVHVGVGTGCRGQHPPPGAPAR